MTDAEDKLERHAPRDSGPGKIDRMDIGARLLIVAGLLLMDGAVLWPVLEAVFEQLV